MSGLTEAGLQYNQTTQYITADTGPIFWEDWFSPESIAGLLQCVTMVAHFPCVFVEVGSWEGRSTIAMAKHVPHRQLFAVDTWGGNIEENEAMRAADPNAGHSTVWEIEHHGRDVFARFEANLAASGIDSVIPCRMGWQRFFAGCRLPVSLLFIDGDHTYNQVKGNIEAAMGNIVPGGIICGDDYGVTGVNQAVHELLPGHQHNGVWWWRKP